MVNQILIKSLFDYCPISGSLLWKSPKGKVKKGTIAGYLEQGYRRVEIDNKKILVHKLIWLYIYGTWPINQIDHINGIRDDNRIENLREVSNRGNSQNKNRVRSGKLLGAYKLPSGKYYSRIYINKLSQYLGSFDTELQAHEAYLAAEWLFNEVNKL